eukprot:21522-Rhodomonas_salina.2
MTQASDTEVQNWGWVNTGYLAVTVAMFQMGMNTDSFSVLKDNSYEYKTKANGRAVNPFASEEDKMAEVPCPVLFFCNSLQKHSIQFPPENGAH